MALGIVETADAADAAVARLSQSLAISNSGWKLATSLIDPSLVVISRACRAQRPARAR